MLFVCAIVFYLCVCVVPCVLCASNVWYVKIVLAMCCVCFMYVVECCVRFCVVMCARCKCSLCVYSL